MKKNFLLKFFLFTVVATLVTFTSCQDYDDDIAKLDGDITSLRTQVSALQAKIDNGAVITSVTPTANGVVVTLSNGESFTLTNGADGAPGADGADGADGSVVKIGDNGNWWIDSVDTGLPARGPKGETGAPGVDGTNGTDGKDGKDGTDGKDGNDGVDGQDGKDGQDGTDGKDGIYYYPHEDGFWYMVDGAVETKTDKTWLPEGTVTAIWEDGALKIYNVKNHVGPVVITFPPLLTNLTFIPEHVFTVSDPIAVFPSLFAAGRFPETGMFSKKVDLKYYVGKSIPKGQDIFSNANYEFKFNDPENLMFKFLYGLGRTRAEDKLNSKATFKSYNSTTGELTITTTITPDKSYALEAAGLFMAVSEVLTIDGIGPDFDAKVEKKLRQLLGDEAVDAILKWDGTFNVPQLMLTVGTKHGEIHSDWVTALPHPIIGTQIANAKRHTEDGLEPDAGWNPYTFPFYKSGAEALASTDRRVLQLKHNEEYDLEEAIITVFPGTLGINLSEYVDVDIIDKFIPTINLPEFGVVTEVLDTTFVVEFDVDFVVEYEYESYDPISGTVITKTGTTNFTRTLTSDPIHFTAEFEFDIDDIIRLEDFFNQDALLQKVKAKLEAQLDSYIYFTHGNGEFNELVPQEFGLKYEFTVVDSAGGAINLPANTSLVSAPNGAADVGKRPIIRVRLVTAQNKPFEEVYIKINWTN